MAKQQIRSIESDCFGMSTRTLSINSKNKGNYNARSCAKSLAEWVGRDFARIPQSGGIRSRENYEGLVGDLTIDTKDKNFFFPFIIETKHLNKITIKRTLSSASAIFTIWNQPAADAIRANKHPMALLRQNNLPRGEYYLILDAARGGTIMAMQVSILFSGSNHIHSLIGFLFSDVKKHLPYEVFARIIKKTLPLSDSKIFT